MSSLVAPPGAFGPIETDRLRLRRYRSGDANLVQRLMGDPNVMRYYPTLYDMEQSRALIERVLRAYDVPGYSVLAVERKSDERYLGHVGLLHWDDVDAREDVEVAYMLLADYWGTGYATEASRACRDWAFTHLGADRVVSFIDVRNEPSIAVARRNGMEPLKRLETNRFGKPMYVYGILRERWETLSAENRGDSRA